MQSEVRWVGIDAHKDTLSIAVLEGGAPKAMEWKITHNDAAVKRLVRRLTGEGGEVRACYEAGPTGYELQRTLERGEIVCDVVAPGLVPQKAGDRVKTDRRDALKLARLLRAGMLTEVRPPSSAEEAVRDLCRTRHRVTQDLTRCRNRLKMFLLRRNRVAPGPSHWTRGHHEWLRTQTFEHVADNYAFEDLYRGVLQLEDRRKALDERLSQIAEQAPYCAPVAHLRCFRGIDTVVAMTIVTELHGFERFRSPRGLMAFLGLIPSEASSGAKQRRGAITKTGNSFVHRVLVEASHHCSKPPRVGVVVQRRRAGQPAEVVAIPERAQSGGRPGHVGVHEQGELFPKCARWISWRADAQQPPKWIRDFPKRQVPEAS